MPSPNKSKNKKKINKTQTYASKVKTTIKKKKQKANKSKPWTIAKSIIKLKKPITKKRSVLKKSQIKREEQEKQNKFIKSQQKNKHKLRLGNDMPNIYIIIAHSSECYIKDIDDILNTGMLKPINILETASKKYTKHRKQFIEDIQLLRDGIIPMCHKYYKDHKISNGKDINNNPDGYNPAIYFCEKSLEKSSSKKYCKYFWCENCIKHYLEDESNILHKPIKIENRINLDYPFDDYYKDERLKVLMGQSSGRKGFMRTYYKIINEFIGNPSNKDNKFKELLFDIIDTTIEETDKNEMNMTKLNKKLNFINKLSKYRYKLHNNKMDTDFRVYPRINKKKEKGKIKERYISGPLNFNLSFSIHNDKHNLYYCGDSWPLGVYNLKDFNHNIYNDYFDLNKNKFNNISYTNKSDMLLKSLLLKVVKPKDFSQTDYIKTCNTFDLDVSTGMYKGTPGKKSINRYNARLYNTHFQPNRNNQVSMKNLMKSVLELDGYLDDDENKTTEPLFITNICRGILNDGELSNRVNHIRDTTTLTDTNVNVGSFHQLMRNESYNV